MLKTNVVIFYLLLREIMRLRTDLRKADQLSIQLEQERDWHKSRYELLKADKAPIKR